MDSLRKALRRALEEERVGSTLYAMPAWWVPAHLTEVELRRLISNPELVAQVATRGRETLPLELLTLARTA